MRYLKRLVWAAGVAGVVGFTAAPGFAQVGQVTTGGGVTTGSLSGTGGLAGGTGGGGIGGGGGGGLNGGGGGLSGGGGAGAGGLSAMTLTGLEQPPAITAPGTTTGGGGGTIDASNFLSGYYGNPQYQGILANAKSGAGPGGFGSPLYGTGSGGGGGQLGFAGTTSATGGRTGTGGRTATGRGGLGGLGGAGGGQDGVVVQLPVQISYPAVARFSAPPVAPAQLQADLSGMIARSAGTISNPAGVQVITKGNVVILRGAVKDEDEARLIEGMIRLTPGVGGLQSELTYPKQ